MADLTIKIDRNIEITIKLLKVVLFVLITLTIHSRAAFLCGWTNNFHMKLLKLPYSCLPSLSFNFDNLSGLPSEVISSGSAAI